MSGSISKAIDIFWNILGSLLSIQKETILRTFVYLFICKVTTTKVNFRFYKQCSQAATRLICKRAIFCQNASIVF